MRTADLCRFIKERESIRVKKEAGLPRPWTKDPILGTYRFCNVHREDDAVTRWIAEHWREPGNGYEDLWFAMVVARLFNLPRTLEQVPLEWLVDKWEPNHLRELLKIGRETGPIFNGAYIVSTNGKSMDKVDYLIDCVLTPMWEVRYNWRPKAGMKLQLYHSMLMEFDGLGSFMAAQVVADMKYVEPLKSAPDWHDWAASGPGSRRGLNRVCDRPLDQSWPGNTWLLSLQGLHLAVEAKLPLIPMHAQDLQNCLCEFDKYERARLGEGRPKQIYKEKLF